jgi:hypothetical protein
LELVVGFWVVPQQIPRDVTSAPPSPVTFPPDIALVCVIPDALTVVTAGTVTFLQDCIISIKRIEKKTSMIILRKDFIGVKFRLKEHLGLFNSFSLYYAV